MKKPNGFYGFYGHKTVNSNDNFIKVTIFGIGGSSEASFKIGIGHKIPAKEECIQILKPVKFRIEECDTDRGIFNRAQITGISKREMDVRPIPPHLDKWELMKNNLRSQFWDIAKINTRYPDVPRKE